MKTIDLVDPNSSERAIQDGQTEDVLVLRDGRPVAIVIPFDEDDLLWYDAERDPRFIESIAQARANVSAGRTISQEQLRKELGL